MLICLQAELEQRKAWVAGVEARLKRDKATFFLANKRASGWVPMVQECIMPRAMYSPQDAIFCAKFMLKLHYLEATNLNIPMYFNDVSFAASTLTFCVIIRVQVTTSWTPLLVVIQVTDEA